MELPKAPFAEGLGGSGILPSPPCTPPPKRPTRRAIITDPAPRKRSTRSLPSRSSNGRLPQISQRRKSKVSLVRTVDPLVFELTCDDDDDNIKTLTDSRLQSYTEAINRVKSVTQGQPVTVDMAELKMNIDSQMDEVYTKREHLNLLSSKVAAAQREAEEILREPTEVVEKEEDILSSDIIGGLRQAIQRVKIESYRHEDSSREKIRKIVQENNISNTECARKKAEGETLATEVEAKSRNTKLIYGKSESCDSFIDRSMDFSTIYEAISIPTSYTSNLPMRKKKSTTSLTEYKPDTTSIWSIISDITTIRQTGSYLWTSQQLNTIIKDSHVIATAHSADVPWETTIPLYLYTAPWLDDNITVNDKTYSGEEECMNDGYGDRLFSSSAVWTIDGSVASCSDSVKPSSRVLEYIYSRPVHEHIVMKTDKSIQRDKDIEWSSEPLCDPEIDIIHREGSQLINKHRFDKQLALSSRAALSDDTVGRPIPLPSECRISIIRGTRCYPENLTIPVSISLSIGNKNNSSPVVYHTAEVHPTATPVWDETFSFSCPSIQYYHKSCFGMHITTPTPSHNGGIFTSFIVVDHTELLSEATLRHSQSLNETSNSIPIKIRVHGISIKKLLPTTDNYNKKSMKLSNQQIMTLETECATDVGIDRLDAVRKMLQRSGYVDGITPTPSIMIVSSTSDNPEGVTSWCNSIISQTSDTKPTCFIDIRCDKVVSKSIDNSSIHTDGASSIGLWSPIEGCTVTYSTTLNKSQHQYKQELSDVLDSHMMTPSIRDVNTAFVFIKSSKVDKSADRHLTELLSVLSSTNGCTILGGEVGAVSVSYGGTELDDGGCVIILLCSPQETLSSQWEPLPIKISLIQENTEIATAESALPLSLVRRSSSAVQCITESLFFKEGGTFDLELQLRSSPQQTSSLSAPSILLRAMVERLYGPVVELTPAELHDALSFQVIHWRGKRVYLVLLTGEKKVIAEVVQHPSNTFIVTDSDGKGGNSGLRTLCDNCLERNEKTQAYYYYHISGTSNRKYVCKQCGFLPEVMVVERRVNKILSYSKYADRISANRDVKPTARLLRTGETFIIDSSQRNSQNPDSIVYMCSTGGKLLSFDSETREYNVNSDCDGSVTSFGISEVLVQLGGWNYQKLSPFIKSVSAALETLVPTKAALVCQKYILSNEILPSKLLPGKLLCSNGIVSCSEWNFVHDAGSSCNQKPNSYKPVIITGNSLKSIHRWSRLSRTREVLLGNGILLQTKMIDGGVTILKELNKTDASRLLVRKLLLTPKITEPEVRILLKIDCCLSKQQRELNLSVHPEKEFEQEYRCIRENHKPIIVTEYETTDPVTHIYQSILLNCSVHSELDYDLIIKICELLNIKHTHKEYDVPFSYHSASSIFRIEGVSYSSAAISSPLGWRPRQHAFGDLEWYQFTLPQKMRVVGFCMLPVVEEESWVTSCTVYYSTYNKVEDTFDNDSSHSEPVWISVDAGKVFQCCADAFTKARSFFNRTVETRGLRFTSFTGSINNVIDSTALPPGMRISLLLEDGTVVPHSVAVTNIDRSGGAVSLKLKGTSWSSKLTIKSINSCIQPVGDIGAKMAAKAISQGIDVNAVYLRNHGITSEGVVALLDGIRTNKNVKIMELDNDYPPTGSSSVDEDLPFLKKALSLRLTYNSNPDLALSHSYLRNFGFSWPVVASFALKDVPSLQFDMSDFDGVEGFDVTWKEVQSSFNAHGAPHPSFTKAKKI